jgi:hypothetical protein
MSGSLSATASNSLLLDGTGSVGFTTTASFTAVSSSQQQISSSLLEISRSYATTGSNTFTGVQNFSNTCNPIGFNSVASLYTAGGLQVSYDSYFSSSVFVNGNLTVFGTQSVVHVSSSQFNIGTNIITVNTATPSIRYGGLSVYDSGSTGLSGSIFWDSEANHWVYANASGSGGGATYAGGMFISGPRSSGLGCEQGTTSCMLLVGQGGDHLTSSQIYHSSTATCIPSCLAIAGAATFASNVNIGTAGIEKLNIFGSGSQFINVKNTTTNADMFVGMSSALSAAFIGTGGTDPIVFSTAGTEKMRISSEGKLQLTNNGSYAAAQNFGLSVNTNGTNSGIQLTVCQGNYGYIVNDINYLILGSDVGTTGNKFLVHRSSPDCSLVISNTGTVCAYSLTAVCKAITRTNLNIDRATRIITSFNATASGARWLRVGCFNARTTYLMNFGTTGNYYTPGSITFLMFRDWGNGFFTSTLGKLGEQYVFCARMQSDNVGSEYALEVWMNSITADQLNGVLVYSAASLAGDPDGILMCLGSYGTSLSNAANTSTAISL